MSGSFKAWKHPAKSISKHDSSTWLVRSRTEQAFEVIDRVRVRDIVAHKRRVQLRHAQALGPLERSRLLGILEHLRIELEHVQHPIWRSLARDDPLAECV